MRKKIKKGDTLKAVCVWHTNLVEGEVYTAAFDEGFNGTVSLVQGSAWQGPYLASRFEVVARAQEPAQGADSVRAPAHYTRLSPQPLDVIEAWGLNFHAGQVVKYVARAGHKGPALEDLRKARVYLDRWIEKLTKETT